MYIFLVLKRIIFSYTCEPALQFFTHELIIVKQLNTLNLITYVNHKVCHIRCTTKLRERNVGNDV